MVALLLAACGSHRLPQQLSDYPQGITLEVPLPAERDGLGAAYFDAWIEGVGRGKFELAPRDGVVLQCRCSGSGRVELNAVVDGSQVESRSAVVSAECPFPGSPIPVTIRW